MGYALFAQEKRVVDAQLNCAQLKQTQRSDEQYKLATNELGLNQKMNSLTASQSNELSKLYEDLSNATDSAERDSINAQIAAKEEEYEKEIDGINRDIYEVSMKETAIEMEVKKLDTQVTALQQRLQAIEQAEGQGVTTATPKFKGVG